MSSSVMNGAVGKSPLIDKLNQQTMQGVKNKTSIEMEKQVCGGNTVKYPSVPVSFQKCGEEIKQRLVGCKKERKTENADV